MSVFHVPSVCANANSRAVGALERLCEHVDTFRTRPLVGEDFERVERELHERFVEAEREVLGELLESLDVDVASVGLGERRLHRVLKSTESYTTAVGPVKVARTLYRSARERAVAPMELRAGIVEGHWTPLAARQASCVVAQMTPSEGEALLRELGNMAPSKSSLDRLPKGLSARWEASREAFESALREAATVPDEAVTVAVSLDGVMVPMKDGKRAEKRERSRAAGRRAKGPAGYQEAGCATLSFYGVEGERLDTLSIARMPEPKKATLKTMLGVELDTVLRRRPDLQVVTVADGAHDNWRYLDALACEATAVVDFYLQRVRPVRAPAFLTLHFAPGECAQVDWGHYGSVNVGNTRRRLSFFVMVLCYSRLMYVEFTVSQTMEHFLGCHLNAFEFFAARIPARIMVDNLKSAVLQRSIGQPWMCWPRFCPQVCSTMVMPSSPPSHRGLRPNSSRVFEAALNSRR